MTSRKDGRGHWTPGKRRSDVPAKDRRRLLAALKRAHERDGFSLREIARMLDVSDRTVRRWLCGEDYPTTDLAERSIARLVAAKEG